MTFSSNPSGAKVSVNGEYIGMTPLRHVVSRQENLLIEFKKDGYQTSYRTTNRTFSTVGALDIVGGVVFLVPFIGLTSPAAWELEPAIHGVQLTPEEPVKK